MNLGGGGLGLGTGRVRLLGRPCPPWHRHESIKKQSRNCFRTLSKKEKKEEQRSSGLKFTTYSKENNALEDRPEGVSTKGNYWGWASVKKSSPKHEAFQQNKQNKNRGPSRGIEQPRAFKQKQTKTSKICGRSISRGASFHAVFSLIQISQMFFFVWTARGCLIPLLGPLSCLVVLVV